MRCTKSLKPELTRRREEPVADRVSHNVGAFRLELQIRVASRGS